MKNSLIVVVVLIVLLGIGAAFFFSKNNEPTSATTHTATVVTDTTATAKPPKEKVQNYYGIDVSHWNGNILDDIKKVDGLSFGICKATQGITYVDPDFDNNWVTLQQKGLIRGAYHFFIADEDAVAQAKFYYTTVSNKPSNKQMTYIVDIEAGSLSSGKTKQGIEKGLLTFLEELEKLSGKVPMVYTNYAFANQYLTNSALAKYPLWLAEYSGGKTPNIPTVWKTKGYTIWQKTDTYNLDNSQVDYDEYHGTLTDLNAFGHE